LSLWWWWWRWWAANGHCWGAPNVCALQLFLAWCQGICAGGKSPDFGLGIEYGLGLELEDGVGECRARQKQMTFGFFLQENPVSFFFLVYM
jgi:hypothetical protein